MQYRKLGKLDMETSALGYGSMRLPTLGGGPSSANIDEKESIRIIRQAIDSGINYVDTAYRYHGGQGEVVVGKALKDGYRDRIKLTTKSPIHSTVINSAKDYDRILDEQLRKLDVEHIDFYFFHAFTKEKWNFALQLDLMSRAQAAQKAGKIGGLGFSFHDTYEAFEEIINGYDWDLCQFQYNFMDEENQAGTKGLKLAASKGIGIVVMEPLRGGKLGTPIKEVEDLMKQRGYEGTLADLALRWVWNHPEVSIALSGMNTTAQLQENLASVENGMPGALSESEFELIEEIKAVYAQRTGIPCTGCGYCMPCPQSINIPNTIDMYNETAIYDYFDESRRVYSSFGSAAGKCVKCGECEKKCPQKIPVSEWMGRIHEALAVK